MSESERTGLKSYYFIFFCLISLASGIARYFGTGMETVPSSVLFLLSGVTLGLTVDCLRIRKATMGINFLVLAAFFYIGANGYQVCEAGISSFKIFLAITAVSSSVLLLLPLLMKLGLKKLWVSLGSLLAAIFCYFATEYYLSTYLYLYRDVSNISQYTAVYRLLFLCVVITMILELFLKGDRIFSGYIFLFVLALGYSYVGIFESNEAFSLRAFGKSLQNSYQSIWLFLILIIYIAIEKPEVLQVERRNVVFSNMVYEELKPIQKKKKSHKFEIPPNVPKKKEYSDEYDGYIR